MLKWLMEKLIGTDRTKEFPAESEPYKSRLEASMRPFVGIAAEPVQHQMKLSLWAKLSLKKSNEAMLAEDFFDPDNPLNCWKSKFGGLPYFPQDFDYPMNSEGIPMRLLAQINFSEMPALDLFPTSGILQIYLSAPNWSLYDDLTIQKDFRILFFPDVITDAKQLVLNFENLPPYNKDSSFPIAQPMSLSFDTIEKEPVSPDDYRFRDLLFNKRNNAISEEELAIEDSYSDYWFNQIGGAGHKLGGYPYLIQGDPRDYEQVDGGVSQYPGYDILLLEIESEVSGTIMWGDLGVAHFFIREEDLMHRDFSKVLFLMDCS